MTAILGLPGALLGSLAGAAVSSIFAQEVRAPRLLEPYPDAEISAVCRTCHELLRPTRIGFYVNRSVLRGQCPKCKHPVPRWAALAEIAVVVMGLFVGWFTPKYLWLPPYLLFGFVIVSVIAVDARLHLISTKLVYSASVAALILFAFVALIDNEPKRFTWLLIGGLGASAFIWLLWLISPGGMGQGDARLSLFLGMYLGWLGWRQLFVGMFAGFLLGSIGGIVLIVLRRAGRKTQIAFGPYLAIGALIITLWPSIATRILVG
jgi:leader peptidase (prepilin peptidase) / N-methyltransferase